MPKIFFFLCLLVLSKNAVANTIITCGPNAGHAFYFPGIIVKAKDAGWHKDGTKDGKTALTVNGKQIDVLFADATGNLNSAISTGGQVVVLGDAPLIRDYFELRIETRRKEEAAADEEEDLNDIGIG